MRKWLVLMDMILVIMAAALLLIDLKIKEDIVAQAKSLQETINGQGTKESTDIPSGIPSIVLSGDAGDYPAVAIQDPPKANSNGSGRAKGNSTARRRAGNSGPGIPAESE
jgi:hypothetical protein